MKNILTWLGDLLRLLTQRLYAILEVMSVNFYSMILLLVLYAFYWQFDQAQDLLLTLNQEKHWQVFLFFFSLTNLAAICWYLPKYLYPENEEAFHQIKSARDFINAKVTNHYLDGPEIAAENREEYNVMVPRFLGTAVILIVGLAILNVANEIDPEHFGTSASMLLVWFGLAFLTLLLVSRNNKTILSRIIDWLNQIFNKQVFWLYLFFAGTIVLLIILALYNRGEVKDIAALINGSLLMAFTFFVFTVFRSHLPFFKVDRNTVLLLLFFSGAFSLLFIIININTSFSQKLNPLICANLAFVLYLSVLYWFRIIGKKRKIYLVTLLLLGIAILFSYTSSKRFYQVKYVSNQMENTDQKRYPIEARLSLKNYFKKWVTHRKDFISKVIAEKGHFPVYVMASEGGGSRAAYWTAIVYAYIQNEVPEFYDQHLFTFTGASGGMTGSSTFFAMKEGKVKDKDFHDNAREMFQQNFLSGTLTRLLGFDIWQEAFGLNLLDNRAVILQEEWADELEAAAGVNTLRQPYLSFWYEEGTHNITSHVPPLLLINTTFVQRGNHAVFSPVTFDPDFYRGFDLLAAINEVEEGKKTVQLNTATVLNASFPYICPAGFVDATGNFVDAGYYDNLGAQTATGVLKQLEAIRKEMQQDPADSLFAKLKFIGVQVRNDLTVKKKTQKVVNHQLDAPVVAFSKISSGYVEYDLWEFSETPDAFYQVDLTQEDIIDGQDTLRPIIPLARYLSEMAIKAMDVSLEVQKKNPNSDLNKIVGEMK